MTRTKVHLEEGEYKNLSALAQERTELLEKLKKLDISVGNQLEIIGKRCSVPPGATFVLSSLAEEGSGNFVIAYDFMPGVPTPEQLAEMQGRARGIEIAPVSKKISDALVKNPRSSFKPLYDRTIQWLKKIK